MEERILYFDIVNGISGDMTIATLLDLGISKEVFLEEINKLNLGDEFNINIQEENEDGIVGTKVEVITKEVNAHRHLSDIYEIIDKSSLNEYVKENAKKIFMVIAEAEAKVHGTTIDKIHFHEVGAIDSIVDVVSACILVDLLCVDKIYATTVPVGSGFVKCDHGIMPVPAPATIEILKDVPIKLNTVKGECTTPTGAAIIKTLCDDFVDVLELEVKQIGYGIGHKKFEIPNILRTVLGVKKEEFIYEIIANIDDMSSEVYSYIYEKFINDGALDIYTQSIYMKKNRPAIKLCILCKEDDLNKFIDLMILQTSTFGIRYSKYNRVTLDRKFTKIETEYGKITVKLGYYNGQLIRITPEYEDCKKISINKNIPLNSLVNNINYLINKKFNINY